MSSTPTRDAVSIVLDLAVDQSFVLHGRRFTKRSYSVDGYADRMIFRVWNSAGKATTVAVRPEHAVEVCR